MKAGKYALPLTALMLAVQHAQADISYAQRVTVEGAGGMSMFGSEGTVLTQVSGDKARTDSDIRLQSSIARMVGGGGKSGNIIRLDEGLMRQLFPDKQSYSETTLAETRAQMEQAMAQMEEMQGESGGLPVAAEACDWSPSNLEVDKNGDSERIAGIKAKQHTIRLRQTCTDPDTQRSCDITWVLEAWLARKVPGQKEVERFHEGYAKALGLGDMQKHVHGSAHNLIAMFGDNWDEVADKFSDLKGYPLRTVMQMGMGGEACVTGNGEPIAMDDIWADASIAGYNAALDQAGYEAGSAIGRSAGEALGGSVAGSIGGAAVGAAAGKMIGGLTGMFKKKKEEAPPPEPAAAPNPADRQVTVFRVSSEVTEWSEVHIPDERFDAPAGWSKIN